MHDIVGRAWVSARAGHGPVACTWLWSECDWTSGHRRLHKKYACVQHRNCQMFDLSLCESGLAKTCCMQADPAHIACYLEMTLDRWKHSSHLFWHALLVAPIAVAEEIWVQLQEPSVKKQWQMASTDPSSNHASSCGVNRKQAVGRLLLLGQPA